MSKVGGKNKFDALFRDHAQASYGGRRGGRRGNREDGRDLHEGASRGMGEEVPREVPAASAHETEELVERGGGRETSCGTKKKKEKLRMG